jgi:hypothetical protein
MVAICYLVVLQEKNGAMMADNRHKNRDDLDVFFNG